MEIPFMTPTTVKGAIAPFAKVVKNLKAVCTTQCAAKKVAQGKINAARSAMANVEATETAVINAATAKNFAASELLVKLEALLGVGVDPLNGMSPKKKMEVGHAQKG